VHDLRDWTHDRHRTVDDTPYGGGAGMVMKPEPWGEALDALRARRGATPGRADARRRAVHQALAAELAARARWCSPADATRASTSGCSTTPRPDAVREVSLGDYVLNGGEVAALASSRRWCGCCPGSWATRSRSPRSRTAAGLLEYPVYTKPASGAASTSRGAAVRRPRRDRRLAPRPGGTRTASAAPTCCTQPHA
jgi:tRNA (guanine37-N1)-methyltransferase